MNPKLVEYLFKCIDSKVAEVGREALDYSTIKDLKMYLSALKEIITEVVKP
jgi:hypothetical protein